MSALPTCDELVELAELLQVPVLPTLMGWGSIPNDHPLYVGLTGVQTQTRAGNQALLESDLVLAVGARFADHAPEVLRRCGQIAVRGVAIRPGHPAVLGVVGRAAVMACPGYPVSAAIAFRELARPLIASLEGADTPRPPVGVARLGAAAATKPGARGLVRVAVGTVDGGRVAVPLRGGASVLSSLVRAHALLPIPADTDSVAAARTVGVEALPGTKSPDRALLLAGAPDLALELLALAFNGAQAADVHVAFCEMRPDEAVGLVRDRACHAAAVGRVGSVAPSERLLRVAMAALGVVLVGPSGQPSDLDPRGRLRGHVRVAVGPTGTPARDVLDDVVRRLGVYRIEIAEVRSDAAALATLAAGHADFAVSTAPAAARAGLASRTLGRAALDILVDRVVAERDPLVRALLDTVGSPAFEGVLANAGYEPRSAVRGSGRALHLGPKAAPRGSP